MSDPNDSPNRGAALARWRWPLAIVAVCLIVLTAWLATLWFGQRTVVETIDHTGRAGQQVLESAARIASQFTQEHITQTFQAALPRIASTAGGTLELAWTEQVETFRAENTKSVLWDKLSLGTTVSEIRVPVTYRYHLQLSDPWRLEVSGQTCIVMAPALRPTVPPAIHTDRMEKRSDSGWARFNAREQMTELEKRITPTLNDYAGNPDRVAVVRAQCRKTVAEFVRNWLLKEDQWRQDRFHTIVVTFADEDLTPTLKTEPTLRLEK